MNANNIESKFTAMGARLKMREIPSRWKKGDRRWIDPVDYALDIRSDGRGQFFEFRLPTHLRKSLDVSVAQTNPKSHHLLLLVRKLGDMPKTDRFLCGHDEREWFVAAVPGGASSVRQAMDALQPKEIRDALSRHHVTSRQRYTLETRFEHNGAFQRRISLFQCDIPVDGVRYTTTTATNEWAPTTKTTWTWQRE